MLNIRVIFVSADDNFKISREVSDEISLRYNGLYFNYISNNKLPLASVYNIILKEDNSKYDYVAFIHADVEFDIAAMAEQLESTRNKYDIAGLCGCSKFNVSISPLNWFCGSTPFPDFRWGCVTHGELGNQCSFFSQHHPDVTDKEVACIDGLCIIMSKKAISAGLLFDETLGAYSHYDTDISLQAILKYNMKVGVLVRRELKHYSVGKSILSKQFLIDEIMFRKKWNFPALENSLINKIAQENQVKTPEK